MTYRGATTLSQNHCRWRIEGTHAFSTPFLNVWHRLKHFWCFCWTMKLTKSHARMKHASFVYTSHSWETQRWSERQILKGWLASWATYGRVTKRISRRTHTSTIPSSLVSSSRDASINLNLPSTKSKGTKSQRLYFRYLAGRHDHRCSARPVWQSQTGSKLSLHWVSIFQHHLRWSPKTSQHFSPPPNIKVHRRKWL